MQGFLEEVVDSFLLAELNELRIVVVARDEYVDRFLDEQVEGQLPVVGFGHLSVEGLYLVYSVDSVLDRHLEVEQ